MPPIEGLANPNLDTFLYPKVSLLQRATMVAFFVYSCCHLSLHAIPHSHQMKTESEIGIALEDDVALAILGESYQVVTSQDNGKAYKMVNDNGDLDIQELKNGCTEMPVNDLFFGH